MHKYVLAAAFGICSLGLVSESSAANTYYKTGGCANGQCGLQSSFIYNTSTPVSSGKVVSTSVSTPSRVVSSTSSNVVRTSSNVSYNVLSDYSKSTCTSGNCGSSKSSSSNRRNGIFGRRR